MATTKRTRAQKRREDVWIVQVKPFDYPIWEPTLMGYFFTRESARDEATRCNKEMMNYGTYRVVRYSPATD